MNDYLGKAIKKLKPSAGFVYSDRDYSTIEWINLEGKAPTQSEIDDDIEQVKADEAQAVIDQANAKAALLTQLGITEEQAKLLLS